MASFEEEEKVDKAMISLPLSATIVTNYGIFDMIVLRKKSKG